MSNPSTSDALTSDPFHTAGQGLTLVHHFLALNLSMSSRWHELGVVTVMTKRVFQVKS